MNKALVNNVVTAVVTAAVLGALGTAMGIFEKGATAISEDQIELVLDRVLMLDSGKTYKGRLSELNVEIATIETRVSILKDDVEGLEGDLLDLVSD